MEGWPSGPNDRAQALMGDLAVPLRPGCLELLSLNVTLRSAADNSTASLV